MERKSTFEEMIERNRGRLTAIARSYAREETEDLVQEMLMQLWRGLARFQGRSNIDTWCYRVALNTAISWKRSSNTRNTRLPAVSSDTSQLANTDDGRDSFELLNLFLQTLSESDRALVLMYLEDMSGEEMSEVLGVSSGALRVRIHRIKARLAEWRVGDQ